jgi:hypothetical protein
MNTILKSTGLTAMLAAAALMTGCAATGKIENVKVAMTSGQIAKTEPIYVKDFDASKTVFKGEYSDVPEQVAIERVRVPKIITAETVRRLIEKGYTAQSYTSSVSNNAVIVDGEVTLIDRGSGAARLWIGRCRSIHCPGQR